MMIKDLTEFEPQESRWADICETLRNDGFNVYAPAMKVGACLEPYIVVKTSGSTGVNNLASDMWLYDVMLYVPREQYNKLEPMILNVKRSLSALKPMIMPHGIQTPSYYDDGVKGHTVTITYRNYKRGVNDY